MMFVCVHSAKVRKENVILVFPLFFYYNIFFLSVLKAVCVGGWQGWVEVIDTYQFC